MRLCFGHTKNIETIRSSNDKGAIKRESWSFVEFDRHELRIVLRDLDL